MRNIVFLYTELAGYFVSCVNELSKQDDITIHIIRWPVNKEAPFNFNFGKKVIVYNRPDYNNEQLYILVKTIKPDLLYCSGWIDKGYLFVCKKFVKKIPVIVGFDNQWKGKLKQHLATILSFYKIHPYFNHAWVPGKPQYEFALRLGFKPKNILTGFYAADVNLFQSFYDKYFPAKEKQFPKKLIYVGRYYQFKGIEDLWNAFIETQQEKESEWELWCLGNGDIAPVNHPKIKHFGFIQPDQLEQYVAQCGVFVLPSKIEPWGVVVHEFAAAGYPLICSDSVGANSAFLEHGNNGFIFESGNKDSLKEALVRIMNKSDDELVAMGKLSAIKAKEVTPTKWANSLLELLKQEKK
jgi:glycosyltransferase involved in cell wall biosynthesis